MSLAERRQYPFPKDVPQENFARGLYSVELPFHFGAKKEGKVRDLWRVGDCLIAVTTDRTSAYDHLICTIPGKGAVLNKLSEFWFKQTTDIVSNHVRDIPHSNVLIAEKASVVLPVEFVPRRYMAKSSTPTSVYRQYNEGAREIYGITFPDGLQANQEFPMGTIMTQTTKEKRDIPLTPKKAQSLIDPLLGKGGWDHLVQLSLALFERGQQLYASYGFILADTKFEFGLNRKGEVMLVDETLTPDSSRIWRADSYHERFEREENPDNYDKEILRKALADLGFTGDEDQKVPILTPATIDSLSIAYQTLYEELTGETLQNGTQTQSAELISNAVEVSMRKGTLSF